MIGAQRFPGGTGIGGIPGINRPADGQTGKLRSSLSEEAGTDALEADSSIPMAGTLHIPDPRTSNKAKKRFDITFMN